MIFVDTGAWFASVVGWDANHSAASGWLSRNTVPLLTTDYIVDETLTLLRSRGERQRAISMGREFFNGTLAYVYPLTVRDIEQAWRVFEQFSDKDWSFTDCTSKVVLETRSVTAAFAFDQHFRQFGSIPVVP